MPKNLKYKIGLLLDDLETLGRPDAIKRLEGFLREELKFMESEYEIDVSDLFHVKSNAIRELEEITPRNTVINLYGNSGDSERRTLAYIKAVVGFLKSKELISFRVKFKKK